jgi:very-short-patch-repair endonuclease
MRREINKLLAWRERSRSRGDAEADSPAVDAAVAELALPQRGVASREQLLELGLRSSAIGRRMAAGRLHQLYEGVYAVGHRAITREGELVAALLAGGDEAVLGDLSAAELWELPARLDNEIHVIARSHGKRPGIRFHHSALAPDEITEHKGIRVTTPERTIVDIAPKLSVRQLEHVIRHAEYEHLVTEASLVAAIEAHKGARGMKRLRKALNLSAESRGVTRSTMERRFLAFARRHGLPAPELNYRIELPGRTVFADCAWPTYRLIVELDSRAAHHNRHSFETDRARDRELLVAGWQTTRVTWRQLHDDADRLASDLHALLAEIKILAA